MSVLIESLKKHSSKYGIPLSPEQLLKFSLYADMLLDWNGRVNLTAITDPEEIAVKHFLDSLLLLKAVRLPEGARLIDVGTGAGFPGLPIKIARPDIELTMIDSNSKRTAFLQEAAATMGLSAKVIHGRAEDLGRKAELRERFDFAAARAVAALPILCEYCMPFVKEKGLFAALKGPGAQAEGNAAATAIKELGGRLTRVESFELPNAHCRTIVLIEKISQTSSKYPRTPQKIAKKPL